MSKAKYSVFSCDGHENEFLMTEFDTLEEAQADCDARNAAEAPKRRNCSEDLYYAVAEPEPEPEWQHQEHHFGDLWRREIDARDRVGSILRVDVIHPHDDPCVYHVRPHVIHDGVETLDSALQEHRYPTLHDAQQAAEWWLTQNPQSVTCLDVGFDLRLDKRAILLPSDGVLYYRYETRKGDIRYIRAHAQAVGAVLKKNGYNTLWISAGGRATESAGDGSAGEG